MHLMDFHSIQGCVTTRSYMVARSESVEIPNALDEKSHSRQITFRFLHRIDYNNPASDYNRLVETIGAKLMKANCQSSTILLIVDDENKRIVLEQSFLLEFDDSRQMRKLNERGVSDRSINFAASNSNDENLTTVNLSKEKNEKKKKKKKKKRKKKDKKENHNKEKTKAK